MLFGIVIGAVIGMVVAGYIAHRWPTLFNSDVAAVANVVNKQISSVQSANTTTH